METVIIKIYRYEDYTDMQELMQTKLARKINELKEYGKKINKNIFIYICNSEKIVEMKNENLDCFAEIEFTGELTKDEKEFYINTIKHFTIMGNYGVNTIAAHSRLKSVIIKKLENAEVLNFTSTIYDEYWE